MAVTKIFNMPLDTKYLITLLVTVVTVLSEAKKSTTSSKSLYFLSTNTSFNPIYIQDYSVLISSNATLGIVLNIAQNFPEDPWIATDLSVQNPKTKEYRILLQYDVNACNILGKQRRNFINIWLSNFLEYGNLPNQCPVLKGNYSFKDMKVDKFSIPQFLSTAQYKLTFGTYFRKKLKGVAVTNVSITLQLQ